MLIMFVICIIIIIVITNVMFIIIITLSNKLNANQIIDILEKTQQNAPKSSKF